MDMAGGDLVGAGELGGIARDAVDQDRRAVGVGELAGLDDLGDAHGDVAAALRGAAGGDQRVPAELVTHLDRHVAQLQRHRAGVAELALALLRDGGGAVGGVEQADLVVPPGLRDIGEGVGGAVERVEIGRGREVDAAAAAGEGEEEEHHGRAGGSSNQVGGGHGHASCR
jgi:hypothetical protein